MYLFRLKTRRGGTAVGAWVRSASCFFWHPVQKYLLSPDRSSGRVCVSRLATFTEGIKSSSTQSARCLGGGRGILGILGILEQNVVCRQKSSLALRWEVLSETAVQYLLLASHLQRTACQSEASTRSLLQYSTWNVANPASGLLNGEKKLQ